MKLSTKGRYAITAMLDLALNANENNRVTLADISEFQGISLSYLEQLFARLRQTQLVKGTRGPGGERGGPRGEPRAQPGRPGHPRGEGKDDRQLRRELSHVPAQRRPYRRSRDRTSALPRVRGARGVLPVRQVPDRRGERRRLARLDARRGDVPGVRRRLHGERIDRAGPMRTTEVLGLLKQVGPALDLAHAQGIVNELLRMREALSPWAGVPWMTISIWRLFSMPSRNSKTPTSCPRRVY